MPINVMVPQLYNGCLKVKAKKVKDLKGLVEKYVPLADKWFYDQIISDESPESQDTDSR